MSEIRASDWIQNLVEQIGKRGMESALIPHYLRVLSSSMSGHPEEGHAEINEHMHQIGWGDIDVDYHLFELAKACLGESEIAGQRAEVGIQ